MFKFNSVFEIVSNFLQQAKRSKIDNMSRTIGSTLNKTNPGAKCINDLKMLYMDTINLDIEMQRQIYHLEKSYEYRYNEIYDQRSKMLESLHGQGESAADDEGQPRDIRHFWAKVLKSAYAGLVTKKDYKILTDLEDIRSKLCTEPDIKFILEFYFRPNKWFSDTLLTKTYYLTCLPDTQNPLIYNGAVIHASEGCTIHWKEPENDGEKDLKSFFDFFNPPDLPKNLDHPSYGHIYQNLLNDFGLGIYLKETVIPKAVLYFTGELIDSNISDSDTNSEEDKASDAPMA